MRAIAELDVASVVVREAKGYSRQKGYLDRYLGSEYSIAFLPKVEISVCVSDERRRRRPIISFAPLAPAASATAKFSSFPSPGRIHWSFEAKAEVRIVPSAHNPCCRPPVLILG